MTLILTVPNSNAGARVELLNTGHNPVPALVVETDLNSCVAVAGFTVAAIQAALSSGAAEVCFPPGIYEIDGPITQSVAGQVLTFQVGAVLRFAANGLGQLAMNGDSSVIAGFPVCRWDAAGAVTYAAIDLHGLAATCGAIRFELNANVPNCSLIRLSGKFSMVGDCTYAGTGGSFKYGVELGQADNSPVFFARFGQQVWLMLDDGVTARAFSALVRYRSTRSKGGPISIQNGGRHFFNAIVEVDGQHNALENPQIDSSAGSNYGVLQKDDAEFFEIDGGEITGNYRAGSVGIACGDGSKLVGTPAVGQMKCFGTKITNWDIGVRITGSADTPGFDLATIANNKTAQVQIDSQRGAAVWPVSGLAFHNCYSEERAFPGAPFLHCKSGTLLGLAVVACEIGYTGTAVQVDAGFDIATGEFLGCRLPAAAAGDAVTTPNTLSQFYFGRNSQSGSNLIGKGAFAANAMSAFDPALTGLVVGTRDTGTATNRFVNVLTDIYTVNFGNVLAGAFQQLTFGYAGLPTITTATMIAALDSAFNAKLAAGAIITFTQGPANQFVATCFNPTGATINAISGGARIEIHKFG